MAVYIFGYGSLISSVSRAHTLQAESAVAARVTGISRAWSHVVHKARHTVLGCHIDPAGVVNGVLVELSSPNSLLELDKRERSYTRIALQPDQVELEEGELPSESDIWIYLLSEPEHAAPYPIPRSYLDTVLFGCLEYGEDFAREFFRTTSGWEAGLKSDRDYPVYPRLHRQSDYYSWIDRIMAEELLNNLRTISEEILPLNKDPLEELLTDT